MSARGTYRGALDDEDEPSCPAIAPIDAGSETIDLMCWLSLDHEGPHQDRRSDEPVCWVGQSEWEDAHRPPW